MTRSAYPDIGLMLILINIINYFTDTSRHVWQTNRMPQYDSEPIRTFVCWRIIIIILVVLLLPDNLIYRFIPFIKYFYCLQLRCVCKLAQNGMHCLLPAHQNVALMFVCTVKFRMNKIHIYVLPIKLTKFTPPDARHNTNRYDDVEFVMILVNLRESQ